jgi:drug/metabolite transporter (DMT)-like permease
MHRRGQLFVASAAVAWSTAGVLQRELSVDTATQLAGRALIAFVALAAYVAIASRGRAVAAFVSIGWAGLGVAACTAVASGAFIVALNHAAVASVFFIQAVAPVGAALLAWFAIGEAVTRRAIVSMLLAVAGVGVMMGAPGAGSALGLGAALAMTLAFSVAVVITRHRRDVSMAPAVCLSQLALVFAFGAFADPAAVTPRDFGLLVALGVGQMALGLALFTAGARLIPASEVALIALLEVVLGPLWVWIVLAEQPPPLTLVGGAIIILAVLVLVTQRAEAKRVAAGVPAYQSPTLPSR